MTSANSDRRGNPRAPSQSPPLFKAPTDSDHDLLDRQSHSNDLIHVRANSGTETEPTGHTNDFMKWFKGLWKTPTQSSAHLSARQETDMSTDASETDVMLEHQSPPSHSHLGNQVSPATRFYRWSCWLLFLKTQNHNPGSPSSQPSATTILLRLRGPTSQAQEPSLLMTEKCCTSLFIFLATSGISTLSAPGLDPFCISLAMV